MNIKYFFYFLIFTLLCCRQPNQQENLVAIVGDREISISEFKDRLNFNPVIDKLSAQKYKEKILSSIIAEALLSRLQKIDQPEIVSLMSEQKHREAVIENLWEEVVFKDIVVNDSLLWGFYKKTNKVREIDFAVFNDSLMAKSFKSAWQENNPQVEKIIRKDTISFTGNIAILENNVFNTNLLNITGPIKIGRKFFVYKPLKEWKKGVLNKEFFLENIKSIKKQYLKYSKQKHFNDYVKKSFKKQNYVLNKGVFKEFTQYLEKQVMGKPGLTVSNKELMVLTNGDEINKLAKKQIVRFANKQNWFVTDLLKRLATAPYPLNYSSNDAFRYSMIRATKRILDDELLYYKGLENGLDKNLYVKRQSDMWKDFYRAQFNGVELQTVKTLKKTLDSLQNVVPIKIYQETLDTLTFKKSDMMVLKTHFPGQTIVPRQSPWKINLSKVKK